MHNPIFAKAKAAAADLRTSGHYVEVSLHPTGWGNSAYVTARRSIDGAYIQRGFRLSDHGVGDRRKEMDEVPTIIDGCDVSVADLVAVASISDEKLTELANSLAEKRRKERLEAEELQAKAAIKAEADAARAAYEARMVEARRAYIEEHHPEFTSLTKTKQRPIIKAFNRQYREENPE